MLNWLHKKKLRKEEYFVRKEKYFVLLPAFSPQTANNTAEVPR